MYAPAGDLMQPDHLVLNSPAPEPLPATAVPILRSAGASSQGSQTGVRLAGGAPGWLVLGESYLPGWRAWCRDRARHEWALGAATPIDGFANGWRFGPTCVSARMAFAPQSTVNAIYVLSAVAIVVLILLAVGVRLPQRMRMRRRARPQSAPEPVPVPARTSPPTTPQRDGPLIRLPVRAALAWGIGVGAVTAFVFAVRFGVVAGPVTVVLLLAGVNVRRLINLSMLGVLAIVALYVVPPRPQLRWLLVLFLAPPDPRALDRGRRAVCGVGAAILQAGELRKNHRLRTRRNGARRQAPEGAERPAPARIRSGL